MLDSFSLWLKGVELRFDQGLKKEIFELYNKESFDTCLDLK
jgi:hypothetical protein